MQRPHSVLKGADVYMLMYAVGTFDHLGPAGVEVASGQEYTRRPTNDEDPQPHVFGSDYNLQASGSDGGRLFLWPSVHLHGAFRRMPMQLGAPTAPPKLRGTSCGPPASVGTSQTKMDDMNDPVREFPLLAFLLPSEKRGLQTKKEQTSSIDKPC